MTSPSENLVPKPGKNTRPGNPASLFKRVALVLFPLILIQAGARYFYYSSFIRRGTEIQRQWNAVKDEVEAERELSRIQARYSRGAATLEGWRLSRFDWSRLLTGLAGGIPGDPGDTQWTQLQFDEEIEGLRKQIPGAFPGDFFPLKRQVRLSLTGVVKSDRPVAGLMQFKESVLSGNSDGYPVKDLTLDYYNFIADKDRKRTDRTQFAYTLEFSPVEMIR